MQHQINAYLKKHFKQLIKNKLLIRQSWFNMNSPFNNQIIVAYNYYQVKIIIKIVITKINNFTLLYIVFYCYILIILW